MVDLSFFNPKVEHADNESKNIEQTERSENKGIIDATDKAEKNDRPDETGKGNKGKLQSVFKRKGEAVKQKLDELKNKYDEKKQIKEGQSSKFDEHEDKEKIGEGKKSENNLESKENKERDNMKPRNQILETPDKLSPDDKVAAGEKGKKLAKGDIAESDGLIKQFNDASGDVNKGKKEREKELASIRNKNKHHIARLETRAESIQMGIDGAKEKMDEMYEKKNPEYTTYLKKYDDFKTEYARLMKSIADLENNNKEIDQEIGLETSEKSSGNEEKKSVKDRINDFLGRH